MCRKLAQLKGLRILDKENALTLNILTGSQTNFRLDDYAAQKIKCKLTLHKSNA